MSKQSKIFGNRNSFELCYVYKPQSQTVLPNSAQKGKSFYEGQNFNKRTKTSKIKHQDEFQLSYRDKRQQNSFSSFYRMKSLLFPISHLTSGDLKNFKVLGTMQKKIIIAFNTKLQIFCFFDQHAMHERIRYQFYLQCLSIYDNQSGKKRNWNTSIMQKNGNTIDIISGIKHSYINYKVTSNFDERVDFDIHVNRYGFQVQYSKEQMNLRILKIPNVLQRSLDQKLIINIAHDIVLNKQQLPKCFQSIIAQISCKSAYKFNDQIQTDVINQLISNLSLCQYPFFCVHGRPTLFTRI